MIQEVASLKHAPRPRSPARTDRPRFHCALGPLHCSPTASCCRANMAHVRHGQTLALACRQKPLKRIKLFPLRCGPTFQPGPYRPSPFPPQLLHRNVQRFQGGLARKAHRLRLSPNSRLESDEERAEVCIAGVPRVLGNAPPPRTTVGPSASISRLPPRGTRIGQAGRESERQGEGQRARERREIDNR